MNHTPPPQLFNKIIHIIILDIPNSNAHCTFLILSASILSDFYRTAKVNEMIEII
jgi:hypothetical protein